MALRDQWITCRFIRGIDTERDPKVLEPGTPTRIENGIFEGLDVIRKRHGTRVLSRTIAGPTYRYFTGSVGLSSRDDGNELVHLTSADELLSYAPDQDAWVKRGDWVHVRNELVNIPQGAYERWDPTTASTGTIRLNAWEDARGGVWAQIVDDETGVAYCSDFRVGGTLSRMPRAVCIGSKFNVLFMTGSELHNGVINASEPTSPTVTDRLLVSTVSPPQYDVVSLGTSARFAAAKNSAGAIAIGCIKPDGGLGSITSTPSFPTQIIAGGAWTGPTICASADNALIAVTRHVSGAVSTQFYQASTLQTIGGNLILDRAPVIASSGSVTHVYAAFSPRTGSDGTYTIRAFSEVSAASNGNRYVRYAFGSGSASTSGTIPNDSGTLRRHSRIQSKPFTMGEDTFIWVHRPSNKQSTDYLYRHDGQLVANSRYGLAVSDVSGTVANVDSNGSMHVRACTHRDSLPLSGSATEYAGRHIIVQRTEYHPQHTWRPVDVDGIMYMPGGLLGMNDGAHVVEHGFTELTEDVTVVEAGGGGTNLTAGSYVYAIVPEWYDAMGNRHLGGYFPAYLTVTGSAASASLSWPTLVHTMKDGDNAPDIRFAVYRTKPNGLVLQRIDSRLSPIVNSTGSDTITWRDTTTEATRVSGEVLKMGDDPNFFSEPMNTPVGAVTHLAAAGDRLYASGVPGYPNLVLASKLAFGQAIAFADGEMDVDPAGGPITALSSIRGSVVAFKRSKVLMAEAAGPENLLGDNTPWPQFVPVTSDVGANNPTAVIEVAGSQNVQGLIFESLRGTRLLSDRQGIVDIGGGVRAYDSLTVVGGVSSETDETVRLYTSKGPTKVFNATGGQWSTFPGQAAVGATLYRGLPAYVDADGYVRVEDTGSYRDGQTAYSMTIETGWMPIGTVQGAARLRDLYVIGDYYSPHTFRVQMAYDFREDFVRVRQTDTSASLGAFPYGGTGERDGTEWAGSDGYGGSDPVFQLAFQSPKQKCQAFKVRFTDLHQSGSGESYSLTEMKARVAVESGRPRLQRRKRT